MFIGGVEAKFVRHLQSGLHLNFQSTYGHQVNFLSQLL